MNINDALTNTRQIVRSISGHNYGLKCEAIIDTLLACSSDEGTFSRYYDKYLAECPDDMAFVLEEVYDMMGVEDACQFFNKAFNRKSV